MVGSKGEESNSAKNNFSVSLGLAKGKGVDGAPDDGGEGQMGSHVRPRPYLCKKLSSIPTRYPNPLLPVPCCLRPVFSNASHITPCRLRTMLPIGDGEYEIAGPCCLYALLPIGHDEAKSSLPCHLRLLLGDSLQQSNALHPIGHDEGASLLPSASVARRECIGV
ncbi:hypothetical protein L7F22_058348 [Adiantum nelumboides]|nr:hypothetical protein [Adiantum nelumboides]